MFNRRCGAPPRRGARALLAAMLATGLAPRAWADPPAASLSCNEQAPQAFLIRRNYALLPGLSQEERRARAERHALAIRYRTEHYGYIRGFGSPEWNPRPPSDSSERTTFMGVAVVLHRRVTPALRCVEQEILATCSHAPYRPRQLSGLRTRNTFHTGEVSNHVYGIAIDVDPNRNPCCGCIAPWPDHPACRRPAATVYERMEMPRCWVEVFERFGFYWLGHDELEDTMHFEFLGDPGRILRD
jgi:hypothetical protein